MRPQMFSVETQPARLHRHPLAGVLPMDFNHRSNGIKLLAAWGAASAMSFDVVSELVISQLVL